MIVSPSFITFIHNLQLLFIGLKFAGFLVWTWPLVLSPFITCAALWAISGALLWIVKR